MPSRIVEFPTSARRCNAEGSRRSVRTVRGPRDRLADPLCRRDDLAVPDMGATCRCWRLAVTREPNHDRQRIPLHDCLRGIAVAEVAYELTVLRLAAPHVS